MRGPEKIGPLYEQGPGSEDLSKEADEIDKIIAIGKIVGKEGEELADFIDDRFGKTLLELEPEEQAELLEELNRQIKEKQIQ